MKFREFKTKQIALDGGALVTTRERRGYTGSLAIELKLVDTGGVTLFLEWLNPTAVHRIARQFEIASEILHDAGWDADDSNPHDSDD